MKKDRLKIFEIVIVNIITLTRLFGAIALPLLYHFKSPADFALITICLFLTDTIDGFLARKLKVSTFFGSAIDAISDKLLNFISFLLLGIFNNLMFIPLIIEIAIMYTVYSTYRYGGNVKSTIIGKVKTIILDIFVILCFLLISLPKFNIKSKLVSFLIHNTSSLISLFALLITIPCLIALFDYIRLNTLSRSNPKNKIIKYNKKDRKDFKQVIKDSFDTKYYQNHKNESIMKQLYK